MGNRTSTTNCIVRTFPLRGLSVETQAQCFFLREEAGRCWTDMLRAHINSRSGKWLSSFDMNTMFKGQYNLHSQSIQALSEKLEANVNTIRELRKSDPGARYPYREKRFQTVPWKEAAIHWQGDGRLLLSNGRKRIPLVIRAPAEFIGADICRVELTWRADHYEVCLTIDTGKINPPPKENGVIAGIDLGEINIAAITIETGQSLVISGRALRSVKQLRNKRHSALTALIDRCQPGSRRHCKLKQSKSKASARFRRQQHDILHKASRQAVEFCKANVVRSIAVGDVRDIQDGVNLGAKANQKISQWTHGMFVKNLKYKAAEYGISMDQIPEDYSTRTCSYCGCVKSNAPQGRGYTCFGCGAVIHRDVNGASNICSRARYGSYGFVQAHTTKYLRPL